MRIDEDRVTLLGVNEPPFHLPFALLSAVSFSIDGINPLLLGYRRNPRVHLHAWLVACCKTRPHHIPFRTVRHAFSRARSNARHANLSLCPNINPQRPLDNGCSASYRWDLTDRAWTGKRKISCPIRFVREIRRTIGNLKKKFSIFFNRIRFSIIQRIVIIERLNKIAFNRFMYVERENNDNFVLYFILWRTIKSLEKKFLIDRLYLRYSSGQYIYIYKNLDNRVQNKNNTRFNFVLIDNTYCFQFKV